MTLTRRLLPALVLAPLLAACGSGGGSSSSSIAPSSSTASSGSAAPASSSSTSAAGGSSDLVVLQDDKHLQNSDNVVAVVRMKKATDALVKALDAADAALTQDALNAMNKRGVAHDDPQTIAKDFVDKAGIGGGVPKGSGSVTVGAANFSENEILANVYAAVLSKAGFDAKVKNVQSREVYEPALESGQLDVMPEYAATLTEFLNTKDNGPSAKPLATPDVNATVAALKQIGAKHGLQPLQPAAATDENAFAVRKDFAAKNNLTTLSDLAKYSGNLVMGGPPECPKRPFCQAGLIKVYGIHFTGFKALDAGGPITIAAIRKGDVQIGLVFSSDPALASS